MSRILSHGFESNHRTTWWYDEFHADCAITHQLTKSAQPAVGAAKHHRQNAYLTAIFGHYIENILTRCGFNLRYVVPLTSITTRILWLEIGDKVNRITHARIDPQNRQKLAFLMKRHTLVPPPTPLLQSVCMRQRGRGNVPTSPPGGGYSSSSRAGRLGRTLWPQNSTSVAETKKGGQNSTMTPPTLEKGVNILHQYEKSAKKGGQNLQF